MLLGISARAGLLVAGLAGLDAAVAGAQPTGEQVAPLPAVRGRFAVGTTVAYLRDAGRSDADFPTGRPITLQLWYPAARAAGATAPYLVESGLAAALRRFQYYGVDSLTIERWATLTTHAYVDAPPAAGKHPLLAFSVGLGVIRANYTSVAEQLASDGYFVAMVESPLQGLMTQPGGPVVTDSIGRFEDPAAHRGGVDGWSRDISFALDQLTAGGAKTPLERLASHIDDSRIGALGHSTGGLVAVASCERDRRVRACVNLDGGVASPDQQPLADFVAAGVTKPTLFLNSQPLYDDTTLARRGMTREQWVKRGQAGRVGLEALVARSRGPLSTARIAGTGHFSFSDAPFVMPSAITRFGGRIIAAERGWIVVTDVLRAYFDRELGRRGGGVAALAARMPELTVTPATH